MNQITAIAGVVDAEITAYHDDDGLARLHVHVGRGGGDEIEIVLDDEQKVALARALLFGGHGTSAADRLPCAVGMRRMSVAVGY